MAINRNLFLLTVLLAVLLLAPLAAFAQDEATPDAQQQITSGLRYAFGVTSTSPDTMLWVRFAVFILALTLISTIMTAIPLFKEKNAAGIVVGVIISYIAIRFMPDSAIATIVIFMPALFIIGFFVMLFQALTSKELGLGEVGTKARYVIMFIAGFITLLVLYQMTTSIAQAVPAATKSSFWPYYTLATLLGIIFFALGIIAMLFYGGSGFFRRIGDAFRESKSIERDVKWELKDTYKEKQIDSKVAMSLGQIIRELEKMRAEIQAGNWQYAAGAIGAIKNSLGNTLKLLRQKKKIVQQNYKRTQDAIDKARKEERDTRALDRHLEQVEETSEKIDKYIGQLEARDEILFKEDYMELDVLAKELQAKNFVVANQVIQKMISLLQGLAHDDRLSTQELNRLGVFLQTALRETYDIEMKDRRDLVVGEEFARVEGLLKDTRHKLRPILETRRVGAVTLSPTQYAQVVKANKFLLDASHAIVIAGKATPGSAVSLMERAVTHIGDAILELEKVEVTETAGARKVFADEVGELENALKAAKDSVNREKNNAASMKRD